MITLDSVRYECDADGIATITLDAPARDVNLLDRATVHAFEAAVQEAIAATNVLGVVVTSSKSQFLAGADLKPFLDEHLEIDDSYSQTLRRMETSGKPFVAALNGTALGGGAELALACHYRVACANGDAYFGFPEVTIGLLPGAGGTQRLPRLIGFSAAVPLLLEGKRLTFEEVRRLGIIHEIVPRGALMDTAKAWLRRNPIAVQPWDAPKFSVPGFSVQSQEGQQFFSGAVAAVQKKTWGNYLAPQLLLSSVYHGAQLGIEAGLHVEQRNFNKLAGSRQAKAMIRSLFFSMNQMKKLYARPKSVGTFELRKVAVIGAGMMGAGIAFASALGGLDVTLIDETVFLAERGKEHSAKILEDRVRKGRLPATEADAILRRITPASTYDGLVDAGLAIEAVFEDRAIKADVLQRVGEMLPPHAVIASNTSTLPITGLAQGSRDPERFIGIHFFSPVDKMQLVEIIRGERTSDETLACAMDYVRMVGKVPLVVRDGRGFFTSRVFQAYVREGVLCLKDGVHPALIENAGRMAGMAVGPLAVADEVSMALAVRIIKQTRADQGDDYVISPADEVMETMVELGRPGKRDGAGFYEYPKESPKYLWPGLSKLYPTRTTQPDVEEIKTRLLYAQTMEALRAYAEGVITSGEDGDVASILAWGFPAYTGGVFSLIRYVGATEFLERSNALQERYGDRFALPDAVQNFA